MASGWDSGSPCSKPRSGKSQSQHLAVFRVERFAALGVWGCRINIVALIIRIGFWSP